MVLLAVIGNMKSTCVISSKTITTLMTVSYTHLDVYKRQAHKQYRFILFSLGNGCEQIFIIDHIVRKTYIIIFGIVRQNPHYFHRNRTILRCGTIFMDCKCITQTDPITVRRYHRFYCIRADICIDVYKRQDICHPP